MNAGAWLQAIFVEALLMVSLQGMLYLLLGLSPTTVVLVAVSVAYMLSVRWADRGAAYPGDAAGVLTWAALLSMPLLVQGPGSLWLAHIGCTGLGCLLSRVQFLPAHPSDGGTGIDAHLKRVRREGLSRPEGQATRPHIPGANLDPLGGLFGGGGAPAPVDDPYVEAKTLQYDRVPAMIESHRDHHGLRIELPIQREPRRRWLGVVAVSVALFLGWLPAEPGSALALLLLLGATYWASDSRRAALILSHDTLALESTRLGRPIRVQVPWEEVGVGLAEGSRYMLKIRLGEQPFQFPWSGTVRDLHATVEVLKEASEPTSALTLRWSPVPG